MHLRTTVAAWQQPITVGNGQKARLAPGNTEGCSNVKVEIIQGKPLPNFKDDNIEAKNVKQLSKIIHLDIELHQEPVSLTPETPHFSLIVFHQFLQKSAWKQKHPHFYPHSETSTIDHERAQPSRTITGEF